MLCSAFMDNFVAKLLLMHLGVFLEVGQLFDLSHETSKTDVSWMMFHPHVRLSMHIIE